MTRLLFHLLAIGWQPAELERFQRAIHYDSGRPEG